MLADAVVLAVGAPITAAISEAVVSVPAAIVAVLTTSVAVPMAASVAVLTASVAVPTAAPIAHVSSAAGPAAESATVRAFAGPTDAFIISRIAQAAIR
ncbi:hypothetical protein C4E04_20335 [Microvirga sp. 17 mud 1-3]|nr:hypothetical protein C4E04_20335 [Microvirga sp. 17 mud 1-3]